MHYYKIGVTESRNQAFGLLTYSSEQTLDTGQIVQVPYGKLKTIGVIFEETKKPDFDVKSVIQVFAANLEADATAKVPVTNGSESDSSKTAANSSNKTDKGGESALLPSDLLHTLQWLSEYYVTSISAIIANALPKGLDKQRRKSKDSSAETKEIAKLPELNPQQKQAVTDVKGSKEPIILHGVTGSGKTRVYLELAKKEIESGNSAMILTPEIGLAPQLANAFLEQFPGKVVITHSGLTEAERHRAWLSAMEGNKVIVGTRSALFSPAPDIKLIIIDEFHDQAFKQTQTPKYDAINMAAVRAKFANAKLVLGSATPDVSRYYRSKELSRPITEMNQTAIKIKAPKIDIIDMTDSANRHSKYWLSYQLHQSIEKTLNNNKQVLIFHNRRGSAPLMLCNDCGWSANCKRCALPMTLHADLHKMRCHVCDLQDIVPINCPDCSNPDIITKGFGTKQIAADLENLFPAATVARFDTDNSKEDSLQKRYNEVKSGRIDILVGTQMLTKGLDLPMLESVGVVLAEAGLSLPDYTSNERVFQQIHQVIGRVGRHTDNNLIILQTYNPNSPFMTCVKKDDWQSFYSNEVTQRQSYNFPPFTNLLLVKNDYASRKAAHESAHKFAEQLKRVGGIEVLGPAPAFHERTRGRYRWQIVIKSANRKKLQEVAKNLPSTGKWQFDLDPASLL